ncbi:HAL/PAL/TAL family ammonia-lyase [Taibaiella soli]|uniref:Aromatic amino acid lyase n=1 Tax=Taibaiella soli TaxID=1649169 RepID=A0A2W2AL40_9BACT|nr:aromatic amino acid ammonia-lyase [Taibaiella soli]PZF73020.1 aromatic amino acid lyase [Taibaiella soli]
MISLGGKPLDIAAFEQIVLHQKDINISATAIKEVTRSYQFLQSFSKDKLIYGINTGFGPMAQYRIDDNDRKELQYNLIRSHSSGMGQLLSPLHTRALMLSRLNTMLLGYSGIHPETVQLITDLINNEAYPCVYAHGGVGASGDLVQLAHLALGLIGEGEFWFEGSIQKADKVFKKLKLKPLSIHIREGLAILNGTSAMNGIGGVNVIMAHRLVIWSTLLSLMINEMMEAYDDHFSVELNGVKRHNGQQQIASWMRAFGDKSKLLRKRHEYLYDKKVTEDVLVDKVQEYYSLRCVPQILGPIYDTVLNTEKVIIDEINSVNDNPIIDRKNKNIFHGGNFHGDYVALEMDKLKIAVTKLSMLADRQLNFILNPALNGKLPPFANAGRLGLNFGIQGMQYPATSTVAENQSLSTPMYIHSIPNNNDNQDIVSMGCNAAVMCSRVIDNAYEVLAVELIALVQAIDIRGISSKLSPATKWLYNGARSIFPYFKEDFAPSQKMREVKNWLTETDITGHFHKQL